jgi:hypothetical protein
MIDDVESAWPGHKIGTKRQFTRRILANGHHIESGLRDSVESSRKNYRRH